MVSVRASVLAVLGSLAAVPALAADAEIRVVIENHRFSPATVDVPAGQRVVLVVENKDAQAEDFESHDLKVEKVIAAGRSARIAVGPLKPGSYPFVGEFHEDTARGELIAK